MIEKDSVIKQFEKIVNRFPDNLAVKSKDCQYSYRELNQKVNQLAYTIQKFNLDPGSRIALLFDQNINTIISILGVLKLANIYVPMEPDYSEKRLSYIIDNSQTCMLITNDNNISLAGKLVNSKIPIINIDNLDSGLGIKNPDFEVSSFDTAYIIYTSGSTNLPKGVIQNHRSILRVASVYKKNLSITSESRISLLSTFSFGISVIDIFSSLLSGAGLFLFDIKKEGILKLSNWLKEGKITHCQMIPSVFNFLSKSLREKLNLPFLKFLKLGGEQAYICHFNDFEKFFPDHCKLVNGFGLSEILLVCSNIINKKSTFNSWEIPIGKTCSGVEILLMDKEGDLVKSGEVGEICIKSEYISPGYLDGSATDLKNLVIINSGVHKTKTFLTGDLGIRNPDGSYIHLGRNDNLIKILGNKIDVGKLEAVLLNHISVKEVLIRRPGIYGSADDLEGLIVLKDSYKPNRIELIKYIKDMLDIPNIPLYLKFVEDLPRTDNGKLSRIPTASLLWDQVWEPLQWINKSSPNSLENKYILILIDSSNWGKQLGNSLRNKKASVVLIEESETFKEIEADHFGIRIGSTEDFKQLWEKILMPQSKEWVIIHCLSLNSISEIGKKQDDINLILNKNYFSQIYFFQALDKLDLPLNFSYFVITGPLFQITGEETINAMAATGIGLSLTIPYEFPKIHSHCIDIDIEEKNHQYNYDRIIDLINLKQDKNLNPLIAIRKGVFYKESFKTVSDIDKQKSIKLKENGVYIITGGLGIIGLRLAEFIAGFVKSNIILIGYSEFPKRQDWPHLLLDLENDSSINKKIIQINKIEAYGSKVKIIKADVAKTDELKKTMKQIVNDFGIPDGIIHAAGIRKGTSILQTKQNDELQIFAPKVIGLLNLISALGNYNPDFIILCSSFSVFRGRFGMAAYISANAFMDAYARSKYSLKNETQTISINWDSWNENSMSYFFNKMYKTEIKKSDIYEGLHTQDALSAFKLILNINKPQIIVSNRILYSKFNKEEIKNNKNVNTFRYFSRSGLYISPGNHIEIQLINIWEKQLGLQPLSINDNFFDIGGDSLTAMKILIEMEKVTGKILTPEILLNNPTVSEVANYLKDGSPKLIWKNLVPIKPNGSKNPFFCVHNLSGNVWGICRLRQFIDENRPLYGLQANGIAENSLPLESVEEMASTYLKEVIKIQPEGPYILGGRCFGGMVAYEMAQQLIKNKQDVPLLFVFDGAGPKLTTVKEQLKKNIYTKIFKPKTLALPDQSLLKFELQKQINSIHIKALNNYSTRPFYGHLVLFVTLDSNVPMDIRIEKWKPLAKGKFTVHTIDCKKHDLLFHQPHGKVVGDLINYYLKKYN